VPERCREWPGFAGVNGPLMAHRALRRRLCWRSAGGDDGTAAHTRPISRGCCRTRAYDQCEPHLEGLARSGNVSPTPVAAAGGNKTRPCGSTTTQGADPLVARTVMHGLKSAMFSSGASSSATTMSVAGVLLDRRRF
jgi:hypothetical protein